MVSRRAVSLRSADQYRYTGARCKLQRRCCAAAEPAPPLHTICHFRGRPRPNNFRRSPRPDRNQAPALRHRLRQRAEEVRQHTELSRGPRENGNEVARKSRQRRTAGAARATQCADDGRTCHRTNRPTSRTSLLAAPGHTDRFDVLAFRAYPITAVSARRWRAASPAKPSLGSRRTVPTP